MKTQSNDYKLLNVSSLNCLREYVNIKNKTINIRCLSYIPKYEDIFYLRQFIQVNVQIKYQQMLSAKKSEFVDINELPSETNNFAIISEFDCRFVQHLPVLRQIESIFCLGMSPPFPTSLIDLSGFTNCKELNIILPYGKIIFPANLEKLTIECHGESFTYDLRIVDKLKWITIKNYYQINEYHFLLPCNIQEVFLEGNKIIIDNQNEINGNPNEIPKVLKRQRFFKWIDKEMEKFLPN